MKRAILPLLVLLLICAWPTAAQKAQPRNATTGRFQLFQGSFYASGSAGAVHLEGVFRIDSETGKTWIYEQQSVSGKGWDTWVWIPVNELK
jgi:hypothetical protein